jgi:hypothetical protein
MAHILQINDSKSVISRRKTMTTVDAAQLEDNVLSTLNACINKISDKLNDSFNPDDPKSISLFRQFCSAINARLKWTKIIQKSKSNSAGQSKKVPHRVNHKKTPTPLPMIKKSHRNGTNNKHVNEFDHLFPPKEQKSGLLYRS